VIEPEAAGASAAPWRLFVIALAVIATAWVARVSEGRRNLSAAGRAIQRGDRVEAIVLARAAADARCPFCESPDLACGLLDAIAKDAEAHGDDRSAVAAWRAVRAATLGSSTFAPASARRRLADGEIARLEHRIAVASAETSGSAATPTSEERLRTALESSSVPSGFVFALVGVGAAVFVSSAVRFARAQAFQTTALVLAVLGAALAAVGLLLF
jgi:hypothetical protein